MSAAKRNYWNAIRANRDSAREAANLYAQQALTATTPEQAERLRWFAREWSKVATAYATQVECHERAEARKAEARQRA